MTCWVETGQAPPSDRFVPKPASGDVANTCPELVAASTAPPARADGAARPGERGRSEQRAAAPGTAPSTSVTAARALPAAGGALAVPPGLVLLAGAGALSRRRAG